MLLFRSRHNVFLFLSPLHNSHAHTVLLTLDSFLQRRTNVECARARARAIAHTALNLRTHKWESGFVCQYGDRHAVHLILHTDDGGRFESDANTKLCTFALGILHFSQIASRRKMQMHQFVQFSRHNGKCKFPNSFMALRGLNAIRRRIE